MHKSKGFTLIEMLIVMAIIGILASVILPVLKGRGDSSLNMTWGVNGVTESRCIDGFKFTVGEGGHARQVLNSNGGGIACN